MNQLWAEALRKLNNNEVFNWFYDGVRYSNGDRRCEEVRELAEQGDQNACIVVAAVVTERMK